MLIVAFEKFDERVMVYLLDVLRVSVYHGNALVLAVARGLPDPHGLVATAGGQQLSARRPTDALDLVLVALQRGGALELSRFLVPNGGGSVEARRGNVIAARRPRDFAYRSRVTLGEDTLHRPLVALERPYSYCLVLAARGNAIALVVPTDIPHPTAMALEGLP